MRVRVNPETPDAAALDEAVRALERDLVVAFATDTLYGLAVDPRSRRAVDRLFALKGREAGRAVPLVAWDVAQIEAALGPLPPLARRLAERFWPGPLSVVVPRRDPIVPEVVGGGATVAIRVPRHAVARELARRAGYPITATSANPSGAPPADTADHVEATLGSAVAIILDSGPAPGGPPSTLVDVTGPRPILVRAGAIAWARVLESVQ